MDSNKESLCEEVYFNTFYKDHFQSANNFAYYKCGDQASALDLVQDAFSKIWENCSSIRGWIIAVPGASLPHSSGLRLPGRRLVSGFP